ncbi:hypothetical protein CB0940_12033 [Cercospora beticola]|uniref:Non-homologous end-joining factor 1 n=1 Tax=Cercospora beticola TaxID=122368 RepID=A0A2G5IF30_CERBT|nr:hypothetical protein CB0940_12033 [Cercospora beticola]PIB03124.1 hypothetical protein CB0940_12033 [Cercospora beticola]WPB04417.1 hypothetical protein RHO25_009063 [Cercospora beticola]CAK1356752.1 unnamed protein product [Cercospora beticola]
MAFSRPWKSLKVSGEYPLLLLKADMSQVKCTLELTDLNRLWAVSLTGDELVESARQQGTSIDPGEDEEQFDQFLSRIQSALSCERKTHLRLEPGDTEDGLELSVSVPLPGSLPTLKWTMQLRRLDSDDSNALEADLVAPLLLYTNTLQSQIQHLVEQLGHKDRVIAKIADKLENIGQDLTQVFPGASNIKFHKRAPKRAQLAGHVDGLAPFDAAHWQAESAKNSTDAEPSMETLDDLLAGLPSSRLLTAHKEMEGSWWRSCGGGRVPDKTSNLAEDSGVSTDGPRGQPTKDTRSNSPPPLRNHESSRLNGAFQRQATPPRRASPTPTAGEDEDEETEDEDDLDAPRSKASQEQANKQQISSRHEDKAHTREDAALADRSHGASNERKIVEEDETEPSPTKSKQRARSGLGAFGGKHKAKTPEPENEDAPLPSTIRNDQSGPKLGQFGGQRKRKTPDLEDEEAASIPSQSTPKRINKLGAFGGGSAHSSPAKTKPRLGAFGGSAKAEPENDEVEDDLDAPGSRKDDVNTVGEEDRQSRASVKRETEEVEQKRENSEERANERRDKLKQDIAEKKKEPVKKKRKF